MATYCFRCPECGDFDCVAAPMGTTVQPPACPEHGAMRRSYKDEGVSVDAAVNSIKRDFHTTDKANASVRDILPSGDDFLKKHRGDRKAANKDIREWNARHEPADPKGNRYRPEEV